MQRASGAPVSTLQRRTTPSMSPEARRSPVGPRDDEERKESFRRALEGEDEPDAEVNAERDTRPPRRVRRDAGHPEPDEVGGRIDLTG